MPTLSAMARKSKAKNYTLKVTEQQLEVISAACEMYSRIHMGQLRYISEAFFHLPLERLEDLRECLTRAEPFVTGMQGGYHSISSKTISNTARIAYDIHQVVRYHIAWQRNPQGGMMVQFDSPKAYSGFPLPEIIDRREILK